MKWLIIFLAGVLAGACALLFLLGRMPTEAAPAPPVAVVTAPAAIPAPAAAPPVTVPLTSVMPPASPAQPAAGSQAEPSAPASAGMPSALASPAARAPDKLLIPVAGIKASQLTDTFNQARGTERRHEALDIMAPRGTEVVAVADGKVVKLFDSKPGGLTVYQFDPTERFAYYYAHLDRYAPGVVEGMYLKRGDLVGYVGSTGNADPAAPHLHFAIFELTPEKQWWKGTAVNPYPLFLE